MLNLKEIKEMNDFQFTNFINHAIKKAGDRAEPVEVGFSCYRDNKYKTFSVSKTLEQILDLTNDPQLIPKLRLPFEVIKYKEWILVDCSNYYDENAIIAVSIDKKQTHFVLIKSDECDSFGDHIDKEISTIKKLIFYINSERPDIEHKKYNKSEIQKVKSGKIAPVVYIGNKYKGIKGAPKGIKLNKKFIVRGHWRNQAIKDGHKIIFIEPFYKGTDDMEEIIKEYVITK